MGASTGRRRKRGKWPGRVGWRGVVAGWRGFIAGTGWRRERGKKEVPGKVGWLRVVAGSRGDREGNNGWYWYGIDCSIPSVLSSIRECPRWLRPATVDVPHSAGLTDGLLNVNALVERKRPLICV
ncbi:hypothetical protein AAC387_Pa02g1381 [Persea americana]